MNCIYCEGDTWVNGTWKTSDGRKRERMCKKCYKTFMTLEVLHPKLEE